MDKRMKALVTTKSAGSEAVTAEQLKKINLFTRRELSADEVYVFSVILCDNDIDRDGEQFPVESLEALGELFIGKTGVFDHNPKAENQSARIFETRLVKEDRENMQGEPYVCLKAWAYMVRCDKNADLILEIDAGIKKEVSVGCAIERVTCSVCGANQKAAPCAHIKGETYDGVLCFYRLENPTDAYEWSFVAVPAQKNAGVTKKNKRRNDELPATQVINSDTLGFDYTTHTKGEMFLNLSELFEANGGVTLEKSGLDALKAEYDELCGLAEAGRAYIGGLRRDVVKLAALARPELPATVMESIAKKLEISELVELQKTFTADAAGKYPADNHTFGPQLGGQQNRKDNQTDSQFKI